MLQKIIKYFLFAIPAVLLVVPDTMFFPFITGKGMLFRVAVEALLALYLFLIYKDASYRPRRSLLLICVSVFTVVIFIADVLSPNFTKAFWSNFERMEGFVLIGHLYTYFLVLSSVLKTKKEWNTFWYSTLSVSIALCLFGLLQLTGATAINQGSTRIDALMGNSAYFGGLLMFQIFIILILAKRDAVSKGILYSVLGGSILFSLVYLISEKATSQGRIIMWVSLVVSALFVWLSGRLKSKGSVLLSYIFYGVVAVGHIVEMVLTQTRGAALGFLGGLFIAAIFIFWAEKNKHLKKTGITIAIAVVALIGGFMLVRNSTFVQNHDLLKRFADISWSNTKGQARQIIWPMAVKGALAKPVFGWGQEGFNYVFGQYYDTELWRHEPWFDRTHNVFLDWLVAGGFLGLLAYLSLYVVSLFAIKKYLWKNDKTEAALLISLLGAYAFQNIFIFDNLGSYILFFSLLAYLHSVSVVDLPDVKKVRSGESLSPILVGLLCLVVFLIPAYFLSYRPYIQNTSMIKGLSPHKDIQENLVYFKKAFSLGGGGVPEAREHFLGVVNQILASPQVNESIKRDFLQTAVDETRKQFQETPLQLKTLLSIAASFNQNGNADIALGILMKLKEVSPKKQHILMQMGISYLVKGDIESAYKILKENYNTSPEYADGAMLFASAALEKGEKEEGLSVLMHFAQLGYIMPSYIIGGLKMKGMTKEAIALTEAGLVASPTNNQMKALLIDLQKGS